MLIFLLSAVYTICAFVTMVMVYHWAIKDNSSTTEFEIEDGIISVVLGLMWPIIWFGMVLYLIVPAIKYVEKLIYQRK